MSAPPPCPRCHEPIGPDAPQGLCASCLLSPPPAEAVVEHSFGEWQLAFVARGGMGDVFKARKPELERAVALKRLIGGEFADAAARKRFRDEANAAAQLDHPNIVPIYDVGECEGAPYFTMRWMEGGSLADHLDAVRADRRRACELMVMLARAVHFGHQRQILHRDLKPANVLLDDVGNPYVADFGTAKQLDDPSSLTRSGCVIGTPSYMAPEQARCERTLTTAVDIYGLGAIFYELLTGRPPFVAESYDEILQLVINAEPPTPRTIDPSIDRDLETICLKCLEKQPERRYASAFGIAADLERFLAGENIQARPIGAVERLVRWSRRNPLATAVAVALAFATPAAMLVAQRQEQQLADEVLAANTYAARMAAGTVLFQLREYADQVQRAAADPVQIDLLVRHDMERLRTFVPAQGVVGSDRSWVDNWSVQDGEGRAAARSPPPADPAYWEKNFAFRDYFRSTMRGTGARVSNAFKSEADGNLKVSISAPILSGTGDRVGMIGAHFVTAAAMGEPKLGGAALVVPCGVERDGSKLCDYGFLLHEGIDPGRIILFDPRPIPGFEKLVADPKADQFQLPDPDRAVSASEYRDPFAGFEGRWLAGLAPVGDTGLIVIVQTRYDGRAPLQRFGVLFGLPFAIAVVIASLVRFFGRRPR